MKITGPLFKWFGSKWMGAKHYPPPIHDSIFEPFAGSAGYSLRHHERHVQLFDADRNLSQLWRWLILYATESLIREIPINVPEGTDIRRLELSNGQALLMKHWQRTNNVGDCWTVSPWGNKPGQWTANTRARVAEEISGIKHWIYQPPSFRTPGTYFLDPPYLFNYRYHREHPTFDHDALVRQISEIPPPRQIIACEAEHPETKEIPTYLPFEIFRRQVTSRRKTTEHHHSHELLYYSVYDR